MYPRQQSAQNQHARIAATQPFKLAQELVRPPEIQRRGFALGPRWWRMPKQLRRRRDERGAEMVEFAFVVVLLIALLYGIISYGLILAAQATITQAAADGARAGIVASSPGGSTGPPCTTSACTVSEAQAATDVGWMSKGTLRYRQHHDHVRLDRTTLLGQPEQRVPDGHRQLLLQPEPAVPRTAGNGRHHTLNDLVEQHPADLEPELLSAEAQRCEGPPVREGSRRTGRDPRSGGGEHGAVALGRSIRG